jgi:type I restriction enzyme S subunit
VTEWHEVRLGDLLSIKHGFAFKGEYFSDSGEFIVLTPGNFLERGGFKAKSPEKYYAGSIPQGYLLDADQIVVAMTEQAVGLLGSSARIPADGVYLHNQRIGLIQEKPELVSRRFLYYLFNSPAVRAQIAASATGAKVRHTAPERIQAVRAVVPDRDLQQRIADVLSTIDELIENNRRRIEILEEAALSLYREWFVHFRFLGHESATFVDSPLGPIPEGWTVEPVGEVVRVVGGGTPRRSEPAFWSDATIPWYTPSDLTRAHQFVAAPSRERISASGLKKSSAQLLPAGTVMLTSRATIGYSAITPAEACTNQGFINCVPTPMFLFGWAELAVEPG